MSHEYMLITNICIYIFLFLIISVLKMILSRNKFILSQYFGDIVCIYLFYLNVVFDNN